MERILERMKIVLSTVGWLILGIVLMRRQIGPWWIGWGMMTVSSCVLLLRLGSVAQQKEAWEI